MTIGARCEFYHCHNIQRQILNHVVIPVHNRKAIQKNDHDYHRMFGYQFLSQMLHKIHGIHFRLPQYFVLFRQALTISYFLNLYIQYIFV